MYKQQKNDSDKPAVSYARELMTWEKDYVVPRHNGRFGFNPNPGHMEQLLHHQDKNCSSYINNQERFIKDFAVFDKQVREQQRSQQELNMEKRRINGLEREYKNWEKIKNQPQVEQDRRQFQIDYLQAGSKNRSGLAVNPITLEYDKSQKGELQKIKDEQSQVRSLVRLTNIDIKSNCGYNLLTGAGRQTIDTLVPEKLLPSYNQKMVQRFQQFSVRPPLQ